MNVPIQLKDQLFNRVRFKEKAAFEKDWQNNGYDYNLIQRFQGENYGVLTGINQLGVLDDDSTDKILIKLFEEHFKETFRVRDHYYIKLLNWDCKKIIFYAADGEHLGELQGLGQYVVGPGSTHPSGAIYKVKKDIPIKEIEFSEFIKVFGDFIIKKKITIREYSKQSFSGDDIKNIPISSIISFGGFVDRGGFIQGGHPQHGSTTGMNFTVNTSNNTWYCFRCQSGGGPSELIAVMEGIIPCSQSGPSCFSKEEGQEVIKIAREKYGLKAPEIKEPQGWALSVNIKTLAERYNFLKCLKCQKDFEFNEDLGFWKCECSKGGIKKFAELIVQGDKK